MKKLGKKLNLTHETLKAYCGCACVTGCTTKCDCSSSTVAYSAMSTTNISAVYSTSGTSIK